MLQAIKDYTCSLYGHQIIWSSSTTDCEGPPPGEYECQHCGRDVDISEPVRKANTIKKHIGK